MYSKKNTLKSSASVSVNMVTRLGLGITLMAGLATSHPALAYRYFEGPDVRKIADTAAVISDLDVKQVNGGINPDYFAYKIKGRVELGSNPCNAHGRTVELKTANLLSKQDENVVVVFAEVKMGRDEGARICTMEYAPVFVTVETTVRGSYSKVDGVLILNIDTKGQHESISDVISHK